jgi:copper chaperone CopZ
MTSKSIALAAALSALAVPALAQTPMPMDHSHDGMNPKAMAEHMKQHHNGEAATKAGPAVGAPDVVVKVNGLVCDFCARSLEKTFRKTGKVSGVSVNLTAKEVRLKFVSGASLDDATIRKLVTNAGYAVVSVQRKSV